MRPVLQVEFSRLKQGRVGGVGALEVGATKVSCLEVLTSSPHLTLPVPLQHAGLKVLLEPGSGRLVSPGGPAGWRPQIVVERGHPGEGLPHHVDHVDVPLPQPGTVDSFVPASAKNFPQITPWSHLKDIHDMSL